MDRTDEMADERPRLLLIETSGRVGRVGLATGTELVAERALDASRRHARDLAPAVAELLRERQWRPRDLAGVIVSLGPGSYTGLRVGIMSAKALAYALGCPAIGVPTFHAVAVQADVPGLQFEVIADAQQGKVYVQAFERAASARPRPSGELHILTAKVWASQRPADRAVTGPGLRTYREILPPETPTDPADQWDPTLPALLAAGGERWARGESDPVLTLEPIYLRPSSAEEQWQRLGR